MWVGLLPLIGVWLGGHLSQQSAESLWEREASFAARRELFSQRTALIERTVTILSRIQEARGLRASARYSITEDARNNPSRRPSPEAASGALEKVAQMNQLQAEIAASLSLAVIYFGDNTEKAVAELRRAFESTDPWWSVPHEKLQGVVNAMRDELFLDPRWPDKRLAP